MATGTNSRYIVPLHRQQIPVISESDVVSYKSVYYGTMTVGSHVPQRFSVVFDTGSGHLIIPGRQCRSEACLLHRTYDREASLYAMDIDHDGSRVVPGGSRDEVTVAFGTGEVTGTFVQDTVCLDVLDDGTSATPPAGAETSEQVAQRGVEAAAQAGPRPAEAEVGADAEALAEPPSAREPLAEGDEDDQALLRSRAQEGGALLQTKRSVVRSTPPVEEQVAPNCVRMRIVTATAMSDEPFSSFAFDGIFGLGLDSLALAPEFSAFGMLAARGHLAHPSFGVFLAESDDESSELSIGGYSPGLIIGEPTWFPVVHAELGHWQVQIRGLRVGNQSLDFCSDGQCRAVVDTGTSLLAVPASLADDLADRLEEASADPPAEEFGESGTDCKRALGAPLHFDLDGGFTVTLEPGDYSRQVLELQEGPDGAEVIVPAKPSEDGRRCLPTMMPMEFPEPLGPKLFIWGEPVLRKYYTVYDWNEKRVGFGLAVHSTGAAPQPAQPPSDGSSGKARRKPLLG